MTKQIEIQLNIYGVDLDITGEYSPEEPQEMYDGNMEGHPGYPADFYIDSVQIDGKDIISLLCDDAFDEIREKVIENQKN